MGEFKTPAPVLLIAGLIANPAEGFERARTALESEFGPVEVESPVWDFDFTDYYAGEMGADLKRQFVAFEGLRPLDGLHRAKITANAIEARIAADSAAGVPRPVNIDPGYVCSAKLVLFSSKDFSHRLYAGDGVFAESTLEWHGREFATHPWTFPDYRTENYRNFFRDLRVMYGRKLRQLDG